MAEIVWLCKDVASRHLSLASSLGTLVPDVGDEARGSGCWPLGGPQVLVQASVSLSVEEPLPANT